MDIVEQYQPALFPPVGDHAPDLKVELTVYLVHGLDAVEVWQRISVLRSGEVVSMGSVHVGRSDAAPADAAALMSVVMRHACDLHGPF